MRITLLGGRSFQVGAMLGLCWGYVGLCWTILAPKLQLEAATWPFEGAPGHLETQLGHLKGYVTPKVGHKMPSRGSACDRTSLGSWELDPGEGEGGGVFGKRKEPRDLDTWPEAGGYIHKAYQSM